MTTYNLQTEIEKLHKDGHGAGGVKRETLHRNDGQIFILLAFDRGSHMREHQAKAWASVQCLEGEVLFTLEEDEFLMHPGDMIVMKPGQRHSLNGNIKSAVLVTLTQSDQ